MISESLAVIAVILVMAFMYLRAGNKAGALLALPLCSVSAGFLLFRMLRNPLFLFFGLSFPVSDTLGVLSGMLAGMALAALLTKGGLGPRAKGWYIILSGLFFITITVAYLLQIW